jgi:hypothetical protein
MESEALAAEGAISMNGHHLVREKKLGENQLQMCGK